jgi:hypothetical protein
VQSYWEYPPSADQNCYDEGRLGLPVAIINCIADLVITCLPIPLILKLNMPLRARMGVIVLFCLGFIMLIASALRTYYFYVSEIASYDQSWEAYPLWIASGVEVNLGLVSIPLCFSKVNKLINGTAMCMRACIASLHQETMYTRNQQHRKKREQLQCRLQPSKYSNDTCTILCCRHGKGQPTSTKHILSRTF